MADFYPADVGRAIVASGGVGTITAYVDPETVTVTISQEFPAIKFDAGDWIILGSPMATCTPSAKDPVGTSITLTLSLSGWRSEDVGKYVRINGGLCKITSLTSSTIVNATIEVELAAAVGAPALSWTLEGAAWSTTLGWPRCGTIHEARLWMAGSPSFPVRFWGSTIGDYLDFTGGTLDDEAIAYDLGNGESNPILHLANARGLLALTSGGEFSIQGGQDKPITPTNIRVRDQSNYGASKVPPIRAGKEIFMTQRAGRKVRALSPNEFDEGQYLAPDITVLAEHISASGFVSTAYQAEPDSVFYAVRTDGQMATLTADRDQDVFAWSRQLTQGLFEDVEAVPVEDGNRIFVVVSRVLNGAVTRYIEMLDDTLDTDCAITGSSEAGASTWSGLDHIEGFTINAKGDGVFLGKFVVDGGQVTLPRAAFAVEFGLDYITTVKTLTPEFMAATGSTQGHQLGVHEVKVRLLESVGCAINLQQIAFRKFEDDVLDSPPATFTGDKKAGNLGWGDGVQQTLVQQTLPYKFHLLSVITKLTANEG